MTPSTRTAACEDAAALLAIYAPYVAHTAIPFYHGGHTAQNRQPVRLKASRQAFRLTSHQADTNQHMMQVGQSVRVHPIA